MAQVSDYNNAVSAGFQGAAAFIPEVLRGARCRFSKKGALSREIVQEYFSTRSTGGDTLMRDVIASGSPTYRRLIAQTITHMTTKWTGSRDDLRVLDFGCGNGALYETIVSCGLKVDYVGYDFDVPMILALNRVEQVDRQFTADLPTGSFDIVFAINVLSYTNDSELDRFFTEVSSCLAPDGLLVLAEPVPAWYWETKFDGLELNLRSRDEIEVCSACFGLRMTYSSVVGAISVGSRLHLPLAWSGIWEKIHVA